MKVNSRLALFFVLFAINFVLAQIVSGQQNNDEFLKNEKNSSLHYNNVINPLFGNNFISFVLPLDKRISAYGDFLVSTAEIIDPSTGKVVGSQTDRHVVINGVIYKAIISARRAQMTTKLNIPLQGVVTADAIILDDEPARIIGSSEYSASGVDSSKVTGDSVVAEVGGKSEYFANKFEFDKFLADEISWEMKIGPVRPTGERAATAYTEGAKKLLVMRLDFSDKPGEPVDALQGTTFTPTVAQNLFNNQVNQFLTDNSYGKTSIQATVTPVLRMPKTLASYVALYNQNSGAGLNTLLTDARNAAHIVGIEANNFDFDLVAHSTSTSLNFAGLGWIGAKGYWLNGYFTLPYANHELGHNLGLAHANSWRPSTADPIGAGTHIEGGDCYDGMGNGASCFDHSQYPKEHFNTSYKRKLDWLTESNIKTVTSAGTYRIVASDFATPGAVRALRVGKEGYNNYWVEFRQLFTSPASAMNGVFIRRTVAGDATQLLDMTPATATTQDAALLPEQTFYDAASGIRFTVLGKGNTSPESIDVKVDFNGSSSVPNPPTAPSASVISPTQIDLNWNPSPGFENVTSYNLRINGSQIINGVTNPYQVKNLTPNTQYTFEVQAVNAFGTSGWSMSASLTTILPPSKPTMFIKADSQTQVGFTYLLNFEEKVKSIHVRVDNLDINAYTVNGSSGFFSISGFTPGSTHTFEVRSVNAGGWSDWTAPVSITHATAIPSVPQNLVATPISAVRMQVKWNLQSATESISSYAIRVTGPSGSYIINTNGNPAQIPQLIPETNYTFEVQSINYNGSSAWSAPVSGRTPMPPPNNPSDVTATVISSTQVNLAWGKSNPGEVVTSNNVRINGTQVISGVTGLSYEVKNLTPNTNYTFDIQAINDGGLSSYSVPVTVKTTKEAPATPSNVAANPVSSSRIDVSWNQAPANEEVTSYNVRLNGSQVISGVTNPYQAKNLTTDTTYSFEVQAVNSVGSSGWSASVSAKTPITLPNAVANVTTSIISPTQINVAWDASPASESVTSYNLRINNSQVVNNITSASYEVKNLTSNTNYTFEVQAVNSAGGGAWSVPVSAKSPKAVPVAPANVAGIVITANQINVSWNQSPAIEEVTSYNLRINGTNVVSNVTSPYQVKNLVMNTTYDFEVQAVNSAGPSEWSAKISIKIPLNLPEKVKNVAAAPVSSTEIDVTWDPSPANEEVTRYNLRIDGNNEQVVTNVTSPYRVGNFRPHTGHSFQIQAVNSFGSSSFSDFAGAITLQSAPTAPTSIVTTVISGSQINILWAQAPNNEQVTSYNVRINGSTVINNIPDPYMLASPANPYPVTNLAQNTQYSFEVQAVNSVGVSPWSAPPVSATTSAVPNPPTNVAASVVSSSQIDVAWTASPAGENVTSYNVRVNGTTVYSGVTSPYQVKNLTQSTYYTFEVQAVNNAGASNWTTSVRARTRTSISNPVSAPTKGMWVFPTGRGANPLTTSARDNLISKSSANGVKDIYASVYQSTPNAYYRLMYNDFLLGQFNFLAHRQSQRVWAAYGAPDWASLGCSESAFPLQRMKDVVEFNELHSQSGEGFDGVIYDVEPAEPMTEADFQALLSLYKCTREYLPANIKFAVAIRAFWDTPVAFPAGGTVKPAYQHIIDMNLDYVVVMGYRDFAGTAACAQGDGIICLDQDEVAYATANNRTNMILSGLETVNPTFNPGVLNKETFYEEGQTIMTNASQQVANHFSSSSGFGGFAVHNYNDYYLSGLSLGWNSPGSIPNYPVNVSAAAVSGTQINVTWSPSDAQNVTAYSVRINGSTVVNNITGLSYSATNLTPNTTYTFEVLINGTGGNSNWTLPVSATTTSGLPSVPVNVGAIAVSTTQINVSWNQNPVGEAIIGYNLRVNGTNVIQNITSPYQLINLTPSTAYTLEIQAVNSFGASNWSTPINISTLAPPIIVPSATFVGADIYTKGNWTGNYGSQGLSIIGDGGTLPAYAQLNVSGQNPYTWAATTTDTRALKKATNTNERIAATFYTLNQMDLNFNLTDGQTHRLALYALDWESNGRQQTFDLLNTETGAVLDTRTINGFNGGRYMVWTVKGKVTVRIKNAGGAPPNAVLSGIFFDAAGAALPEPPPVIVPSAAYVGEDGFTKGNWVGNYGAEGKTVLGDAAALPAFTQLNVTGQNAYTWVASTTDTRALRKISNNADRIASTFYTPTQMDLSFDFTDGIAHRLTLYALDWDTNNSRTETFELVNTETGAVLDTKNH